MKRAYRIISAVLLAVALLSGSAAFAAPQDAAAAKPAYTLAEYNAYQDADQCSAPDALDPSQMK